MKISADKKILLEAIVPAASFTSNKETVAVVEGILLRTVDDKTVDICAYDLEKGFKTTIGCIVEEEGCYAISSGRFVQIIKSMPDGLIRIEVNPKNLRVTVTAGRSKMEMSALSGDKFPDFPDFRGDRGFNIRKKDLRVIIGRTMFAIGQNNPRPELNGLFLKVENGELSAVSCDGNRLAVYTEKCTLENVNEGELSFGVIIPFRMIQELTKFASDTDDKMRVAIARKHIIFFIDNFIIFTRMIDYEYIDYNRFIPKAPKIFCELETAALTSSLERAMFITEDRQQRELKPAAICTFTGDTLSVYAYSIIGKVNDEIPMIHDGEDLEIGFNCRFLYEAMKACDEEKVKLSLTSPLMGMTIEPVMKSDGKKLTLLVLPVRLNK
ncbi:MAG: DNA polymerase III subunit beta [Firmicutes bacterium]|nr:DNA polymerase III subunit beta [Candidatus Colimorpha enterica]